MKHFADNEWADFARGVTQRAKKQEMDNHVASGCIECKQALTTWSSFVLSAKQEKQYTPPADVVRRLQQEFTLQNARDEQPSKLELIASLVFDSLTQPAVAGVRSSGGVGARQLMYEVGGITIDLRLEGHPPSSRMSLIGQVLEKDGPRGLPIPVLVFNERGNAVLETQTSDFGEFQFEFDAKEPLRLSIELDSRRNVQLPLRELQVPLQR